MQPERKECTSGECHRSATIVITFIDNFKAVYCRFCAKKIGGDQEHITQVDLSAV